jgi:hypothetical protein
VSVRRDSSRHTFERRPQVPRCDESLRKLGHLEHHPGEFLGLGLTTRSTVSELRPLLSVRQADTELEYPRPAKAAQVTRTAIHNWMHRGLVHRVARPIGTALASESPRQWFPAVTACVPPLAPCETCSGFVPYAFGGSG